MFAYPWGKEGTPLEHIKGPRTWQREDLQEIGEHIRNQKLTKDIGNIPAMFRKATASGRGSGKSAFLSWLCDWMMTTRIGSTSIVTANTEAQLESRTFAEIGKWTTLLINEHWFEQGKRYFRPAEWFKKLLHDQLKIDTNYYYCQGQTWSAEKPDAFAGVHNHNGVLLLMDEGSGIDSSIWKVSEGFFTEPIIDRYWMAYSNPRANSGAFFDCFHSAKNFWRLRQLDSRTVDGVDPKAYEGIINQYGVDSDEARVEVYGQFPIQGNNQFISNALVQASQEREIPYDQGAPLIMGVDIARYGNDSTVIRFRQGRDGRSIPAVRMKNMDLVYQTNEIAHWIDKTNPDAVNIDAGNAGAGIIDMLRSRKYRVNEVWFGSSASSKEWANKRTEMYASIKAWLPGGALDTDSALFRDLTAPEYHFHGKSQDAVMLESKDSMKARGLPSPDDGDAFALTFAVNVARRDIRASRYASRGRQAQDVDYNLFG
ncbi:terminase [Nitrosovibrio sp. Nv4]|uniref:terminase n=1 Tax=Nitrosovibrio sp. Nv4 TaxID=1945880 RepID=UPI00117F8198|nr:terminase [Nitrosovibrio sp. Nv4]